jgi:nucleotide-binding universal stress UspA family protein
MEILVGIPCENVPEHVIQVACEHAGYFNAKVHLVTSLEGRSSTVEKEIEGVEKSLEYVKDIFEKRGILCETHILIRGNSPEIDLVEFANKNQVYEIIVGTRKRTPLGKAVLGSVAQRVAMAALCPVVLVK